MDRFSGREFKYRYPGSPSSLSRLGLDCTCTVVFTGRHGREVTMKTGRAHLKTGRAH